jgi:DNA-binding transcriptional ArsR family regulator
MNEVDDAVLEYFEEYVNPSDYRPWVPPTAVYVNLVEEMGVVDRSTNTISRRMKRLGKMGLLERREGKRTYYRLTDKGLQYLHGELDADDLSNPDED